MAAARLASLNSSLFVDRETRGAAAEQAEAMRTALAQGQPLTLFPEGTTGNGIVLRAFRSSLLAAVAPPPPGIVVQPVALDYGSDAASIAWTEDESIGQNALPLLQRRGGTALTLRFLAPLPPADRKTTTAAARAAIAGALGQA